MGGSFHSGLLTFTRPGTTPTNKALFISTWRVWHLEFAHGRLSIRTVTPEQTARLSPASTEGGRRAKDRLNWDPIPYYAIYGNIYHQYTPNVSIYTIHGSYAYGCFFDTKNHGIV